MTPDLTSAEQATVDRFDAGPDAPESLRQQVAGAIWKAEADSGANGDWYLAMADAAIAVITGGAK